MDITGIGSILDFGGKLIDRIFPDKAKADEAKLALLKLQQDGQLEELKLHYSTLQQQAAVNLEEAKNPNWFVSGWRPFVGWVCGVGLLYSFLIQPILIACSVGAPPVEIGVLIEMLLSLLGVAGYRTYEKINGVANK